MPGAAVSTPRMEIFLIPADERVPPAPRERKLNTGESVGKLVASLMVTVLAFSPSSLQHLHGRVSTPFVTLMVLETKYSPGSK